MRSPAALAAVRASPPARTVPVCEIARPWASGMTVAAPSVRVIAAPASTTTIPSVSTGTTSPAVVEGTRQTPSGRSPAPQRVPSARR